MRGMKISVKHPINYRTKKYILFSATAEVARIEVQFMKDPIEITVGAKEFRFRKRLHEFTL
jgi:hypothetical protein